MTEAAVHMSLYHLTSSTKSGFSYFFIPLSCRILQCTWLRGTANKLSFSTLKMKWCWSNDVLLKTCSLL